MSTPGQPPEPDDGPDPEDVPGAPVPSRTVRFDVSPAGAGRRLDTVLADAIPGLSRSRLASLCDEGAVTVAGATAKPSLRVKAGQAVVLDIPAPAPAVPQPEDIPLTVLFEDADVVVVDKPAGLVVHPAAGVPSGTLVNALLHHVTDLRGIGGELRPGIVHRLDKDTSGAMVVAKHDAALATLQKAFQDRAVEKRYVAIVHGSPPTQGTWDTPFGRHPTDRVRMTSRSPAGIARRAVTHWTVLESFEGAALLDITLETGRTHQIRVHASEHGFPLLGDATYGGTKRDQKASDRVRRASLLIGRQALHARLLRFPHPSTGATVTCEAPLPPAFVAALEVLRGA